MSSSGNYSTKDEQKDGYCDPVIAKYKEGVDRTLLRENLKLSVQERFEKFEQFMKYVEELKQAGKKSRLAKGK